jgi:hypothetical protein
MSKVEHRLKDCNIIALWRNRAYTSQHAYPSKDEMDQHLLHGTYPNFPSMPQHFVLLDKEGFEFTFDHGNNLDVAERRWGWDHLTKFGTTGSHFHTLEAAAKNAYWHLIGLYDGIRTAQSAGIKVEPHTIGEGTHYWRAEHNHRVSALFPTEEAAWRDAITTMEEVWARNPRMRPHSQSQPSKRYETFSDKFPGHNMNPEGPVLGAIKRMLIKQGFRFTNLKSEGECWTLGTLTVGGHASHAACIKDALKIWLRDNPEGVPDVIGWLGLEGAEIASAAMTEIPAVTTAEDALTSAEPAITPPEVWPEVGSRALVTPHNTIWGFSRLDPVLCDIRGYWGDWVWLQQVGTFIGTEGFITTRIDKCDIEEVK